jgi:hypothetical protein
MPVQLVTPVLLLQLKHPLLLLATQDFTVLVAFLIRLLGPHAHKEVTVLWGQSDRSLALLVISLQVQVQAAAPPVPPALTAPIKLSQV